MRPSASAQIRDAVAALIREYQNEAMNAEMKIPTPLANILLPAYGPCPEFATACKEMRWNPDAGHVPRGFLGACGELSEVELLLVFAEPGDPHVGERHSGLTSA